MKELFGTGVLWGLPAGVGVNLIFWIWLEPEVSWLWWNVFGCLATAAIAYPASFWDPAPATKRAGSLIMTRQRLREAFTGSARQYVILAGYFIVIILIAVGLQALPAFFASA